MNVFDLIKVILADTEMDARPVKFKLDKDGYPEEPEAYQTTCPKCSQLVDFKYEDILIINDKKYISGCEDCPLPKKRKQKVKAEEWEKPEQPEPTSVNRTPPRRSNSVIFNESQDLLNYISEAENRNEFVNPIESGTLEMNGATPMEITV